eukprot:gene12187-biopygen22948
MTSRIWQDRTPIFPTPPEFCSLARNQLPNALRGAEEMEPPRPYHRQRVQTFRQRCEVQRECGRILFAICRAVGWDFRGVEAIIMCTVAAIIMCTAAAIIMCTAAAIICTAAAIIMCTAAAIIMCTAAAIIICALLQPSS